MGPIKDSEIVIENWNCWGKKSSDDNESVTLWSSNSVSGTCWSCELFLVFLSLSETPSWDTEAEAGVKVWSLRRWNFEEKHVLVLAHTWIRPKETTNIFRLTTNKLFYVIIKFKNLILYFVFFTNFLASEFHGQRLVHRNYDISLFPSKRHLARNDQ